MPTWEGLESEEKINCKESSPYFLPFVPGRDAQGTVRRPAQSIKAGETV